MPGRHTRTIFISHVWNRNQPHWKKVVEWLDSEPDFSWKNCSFPDVGMLPDKSACVLTREMARQIATAQAVIILSDLYASNSAWIDFEINMAKRLKKIIIGVAPLEQGRVPKKIREAANLVVGGSRDSLVGSVRILV